MSKIFYISDTHFFHENVLKLDNRPFDNIEHMHEIMLRNWNEAVSKEDLVWILGDVLWHFKSENYAFMKQLNGHKRLVKGNHDKCHSGEFKRLFESISDYEKTKDGDRTVILCHYPILAYDGSYGGRNIHLHGHTHTTSENDLILDYINRNKSEEFPMKIFNVGCMMPHMNYTPRTLDEIIKNNN